MKIKIAFFSLMATCVLTACGLPGPDDPVVILVSSKITGQVMPSRVAFAIVRVDPPLLIGYTKANTTAKLFVNEKAFNMNIMDNGSGTGIVDITYITENKHCITFPSGTLVFKYQLFKEGVLFKEDSTTVLNEC